MMRFQSGENTIYKGYRLRYILNKENAVLLSDDLKIDGFSKYSDRVYEKTISKSEITNGFSYIVRCRKAGHVLNVQSFKNENQIIAYTGSIQASKDLEMECIDRGVYEKEFHFSELDAIWEERSESSDGLPFPEDLARIEYLKGGPGE
jgi:hypothetical protein